MGRVTRRHDSNPVAGCDGRPGRRHHPPAGRGVTQPTPPPPSPPPPPPPRVIPRGERTTVFSPPPHPWEIGDPPPFDRTNPASIQRRLQHDFRAVWDIINPDRLTMFYGYENQVRANESGPYFDSLRPFFEETRRAVSPVEQRVADRTNLPLLDPQLVELSDEAVRVLRDTKRQLSFFVPENERGPEVRGDEVREGLMVVRDAFNLMTRFIQSRGSAREGLRSAMQRVLERMQRYRPDPMPPDLWLLRPVNPPATTP